MEEERFDESIRPLYLKDYIGQDEIRDNIDVFIKAAKLRDEALDHVLLYGPPGLGKTTLAHIIAHEMNTSIKTITGPSIEKTGDLASVLSTLEPGDVLFIDEIHRLPAFVEEVLYSAMEDFKLDIVIGGDGGSRSISINLPPFTLVGATTRAGDLTAPLRDRFGIIARLEYYKRDDLVKIIKRTARVLETEIDDDAAIELAKRSRGTPRIANRLFKRVSDFALVEGLDRVTKEITNKALNRLKIDSSGLNDTDYRLIMGIIKKFNGGPVGIDAIASVIGEDAQTIEDVYEPYLLQQGFLKRTARGRVITESGYRQVGISYQDNLFTIMENDDED